eukprot:8518086-Ditylum_brightwellii.AAC.1
MVPPKHNSLKDFNTDAKGQEWMNAIGRISDAISNLTSIETLDLHDNDLKGDIPSEIGKLVNLSSFIVSHNVVTGAIPNGFDTLSNLQLLYLHRNCFWGTVPQLASNGQHYSSFILECGSPSHE